MLREPNNDTQETTSMFGARRDPGEKQGGGYDCTDSRQTHTKDCNGRHISATSQAELN